MKKWKEATIIFIEKQGKEAVRLIFLNSFVVKLYERIINNKQTRFIGRNE
jgi:hypothetical protein